MLSTLRFLVNKPAFLIAAGIVLVLVYTTHRPAPPKHINPWAVASSSDAASDTDSDNASDSPSPSNTSP